jgi:hypothetical protein
MRKGIGVVVAYGLIVVSAACLYVGATIGSHVFDGDNEIADWVLALMVLVPLLAGGACLVLGVRTLRSANRPDPRA